jgi:hypothetical protein
MREGLSGRGALEMIALQHDEVGGHLSTLIEIVQVIQSPV